MKRLVSWITAIAMTVTTFAGILPVSAVEQGQEETQQQVEMTDYSIEGGNAFGEILADALSTETEAQAQKTAAELQSSEWTAVTAMYGIIQEFRQL